MGLLSAHPTLSRPGDRRARRSLLLEALEDRTLPDAGLGSFLGLSALAVDTQSYDSSRILVGYRPGALNLAGAGLGKEVNVGAGVRAVLLNTGVTVQEALAVYRHNPGVLFAQPDYTVRIAVNPNDPSFGSLWGLNNTGQNGGKVDADIDAPEAWNISTGSGNTVVAVIDTGVDYNHPDLKNNMWKNPGEVAGNGIDDDGNGYVDDIYGYDFANNDSNPFDDNGHGTHVAGTIGAEGNNSIGVVGVNWRVKIMALKFLSASGSGSTSNAIRALNYAVAMGAKISNNSWGGGGYDSALFYAIQNARAAGHIFVAAAGNSGVNTDTSPNYPSNYALDNVISVAATDRYDNLASFSNYGASTVDLGAPGVSILSTTPNNTYSTYSGTSMATPHVTGVVALLRDLHPDWSYSKVIQQVLSSVDPIPSLAGKTVTGGRLNAYKALTGGAPDTTGARVTAMAPQGGSGSVTAVRLTFNEAINPTTFTTADVVSLTGPAGSISATGVTPVTGSNNTQFDVTFATQTTPGTYTIVVGPDVRDTAGNQMDQNQNGINGETTADRFTGTFSLNKSYTFNSTDVPKPIKDVSLNSSKLVVNQAISISDVNVKLSLTHTWDGDLYIHLRSPLGTDVVLSNRRGASGDNFTNTVFDDEATKSIANGIAPFTGSFRPDGLLSAFDGQNAYGTWTLWVDDKAIGDVGTITSWSITIEGNSGAAGKSVRSTRPVRAFLSALEQRPQGPSAPRADGPTAPRTSFDRRFDGVFEHALRRQDADERPFRLPGSGGASLDQAIEALLETR